MSVVRGRVVDGGRVILPASFRKALGIEKGDTVLIELNGDGLQIRPARSALHRLQARLRDYAPPEASVVDELIAERRAEAARD
jgi:AbrB family looped-hinge helix DNA binding protein